MKIKSFAMLIASGLAAACLAYVAPAMADDISNGDLAMQPSSSSDNSSDNGSANSVDQGDSSSTDNNGSAATMDQGSPDTATGDDDY
ncbi:hypothetical protein AQUSIP_13470 [Aquicella siphonis]|uniref:Uncharacterized protein n=1 Tax=Aquicella siphonis TaxID=254247 RepID=A0A5E4PHH9_9COXI|nr:hypothetical protein [Aquicella siphonis]VVC76045.1 hypothetical protein AQUSIP_13470 [Aquicella siphonis]